MSYAGVDYDDGWYRREAETALSEARTEIERLQAALADAERIGAERALTAAADEVRRVRLHGLRPDEDYGPYSESFEAWLRARTENVEAVV
jgi:uncharacterized protein YecE (DUF72 family)